MRALDPLTRLLRRFSVRQRAGRADLEWFDRFMAREGGEAPGAEDRA